MPGKTNPTESDEPVLDTTHETETYDTDTSVQNAVGTETKCSCGDKCNCHVENIEISAGTGISIELNGVWYKFDYSEKRTVNPNEDINTQRKFSGNPIVGVESNKACQAWTVILKCV